MHGYGADMCGAAEVLAAHQPPPPSQLHQQAPPQPQQQQPSQQQQQAQQQPQSQPHQDSKYDTVPFDDGVHSDSYVSYLESDDSMTAPLSSTTSP